MTIYDGSNPDAIITLTDTRADQQTYEVAKLPDNKCWMLENLKLGSTAGTVTLTPSDSNVVADFTLPQLNDGSRSIIWDPDNPANDYDTPYVHGPVLHDTGMGATNYGYLYNWSAATAGETRTTAPAGSGNAPYSICAAGWRLPTAGWNESWEPSLSDFVDLDRAFGGSGYGSWGGEVNIAQWQHSGPFKGVFAGVWWGWEGFNNQGVEGVLWSSSANPHGLDDAFNVYFGVAEVIFISTGTRSLGFGVRCLLN